MNVLVDDQLLGAVLRGEPPGFLADAILHTTGCWYVRLCQAALGTNGSSGMLSAPILALPPALQRRALAAVMALPEEIGLLSLRTLAPLIGELRRGHDLNLLGIEALAAARRLGASVSLSAHSPRLEVALEREGLAVRVDRSHARGRPRGAGG